MRETRAETARALVAAIGLHALLFALAFVGLWWQRPAEDAGGGEPMEAVLVDASSLSTAVQRAMQERPEPATEPAIDMPSAPPPQPLPEPLPEDAIEPAQTAPQELLPEPEAEDQPEVSPFAQAQAEVEALQEARRRQEQVDLTEQQRQDQAQRQRRLSALQEQRQQQLDDIRRQRAEAAGEAQAAQEKLEQLAQRRARSAAEEAAAADASASGPKGVIDRELLARYRSAIQEAVERNWTRPDSVPPGTPCKVFIVQIPGGEVISAEVVAGCPYDEVGKRSIEAAVLRAQPLPYAGFESVYSRELIFTFRAPD